jgi:hypothetical protein
MIEHIQERDPTFGKYHYIISFLFETFYLSCLDLRSGVTALFDVFLIMMLVVVFNL